MPDNRILLPLDGSNLSERSLRYVPMVANLGAPQFELISVHESWDERASDTEIQSYLEAKAGELRDRVGVSTVAKVLPGIPYLSILEEAEDERVSLIVISTHGWGSAVKWRFGSVADKVIRGSPAPVLVIGPYCQPPVGPIRRIFLPLDGSELAELALPVAGLLAIRNDAQISLCSVYPPRDTLADTSAWEEETKRYLVSVQGKLPDEVTGDAVACIGSPSDTLQVEAAHRGADIIVMSSHGSHGFMSYALGSVTERLLSGPVPVLIVRPGQALRVSRW